MFKKMVCAVVLCVAVAPQMHAQEEVSADVQMQVLERQLEEAREQYLDTLHELSAFGTPCAILAVASVLSASHLLFFPFGIYFSYKMYAKSWPMISQLLDEINKQREFMKECQYKIVLYRSAQKCDARLD